MPYHSFLDKGGEMGSFIRTHDWSQTSLGVAGTWPQALLTSLNIMLNTRFPMLVFWGSDLVTFYNDAFRPSLGNNGKHPSSLGQPGHISWAESWPVIGPMIYGIMQGSDAVWFEDQKLPLYRDGKMGYAYWTYSFSPILSDDGTIGGVLVTCSETTKAVESTQQLAESEDRFQNLVRDASVGIIVLLGDEMRVEIVNEAYGKLIGFRPEDLVGKNLFSIVPAAEAYYRPLINEVRATGKALHLYETPYFVTNDKGEPVEGYLNVAYQPYREKDGTIGGIVALCQDITAQVKGRQQLDDLYTKEQGLNEELAAINEELTASNEELLATQNEVLKGITELEKRQEQLRLTLEASNLGTWSMDIQTRQFITSDRFREIYGYGEDEIITRESVIAQIPEEHRAAMFAAVNAASENDGRYEVEYPFLHRRTSEVRWIKAVGKRYTNKASGVASSFGTAEDITERKRDEQRKNDFIGMVSHELKTPLTSVSGFLQLLSLDVAKKDYPFALSLIEKAARQTNKMKDLIHGFLNLSRLESGKLNIDKTRFNLADLIKETEEEIRSLYTTHRFIFHPVEDTWVEADRDKIASVFNNLLSNAVKYSPAGRDISIRCISKDGIAEVSVQDEGLGIRAEDIPRLFGRFYRVENTATQSVSGFGIGLYICAEIIQRHAGAIRVESEEGKGSIFSFTLPTAEG